MDIKYTTLTDIKANFKKIDRNLILKDNSQYYALLDKGQYVSFLAIQEKNGAIKLQANFTKSEYRGKGYFTYLLKYITHKYNNVDIYADCLDASKNIYKKCGYTVYNEKQYKSFKITYMKRSAEHDRKTTQGI